MVREKEGNYPLPQQYARLEVGANAYFFFPLLFLSLPRRSSRDAQRVVDGWMAPDTDNVPR
jgi:hypothetical protein